MGAAPPAAGAPALPGAILIGGLAVPPVAVAPAAPDGIILIDGKSEALPTDASSAVRIQALAKADPFGPASDGEVLIALRLSLEPKLQWQSVDKVTVAKAIDDQKQELAQTATDAASAVGPLPPGAGFIARPLPVPASPTGQSGLQQDVVVHLKKGDKAAKALTELSGTVTATVLGETAPVITATDILKANGKVFKGGDNGQIKVADVSTNDNGQITIHLELQEPTDFVPVGNGAVGPIFRRPIRRLPLAVPAPARPARRRPPWASPSSLGRALAPA